MLPENFEFIAKTKKIRYWEIKKCDICGESIGFMIQKDNVYFDETCDCSPRDMSRNSSWGELAEVYNKETNERRIEKYKRFWSIN